MPVLYEQLDNDKYEIRIISLEPGLLGSIIRCTLETKSLVQPSEYSALSYCWGDESGTRDIVVNDIPTTITASLEGALQCLRQRGIARVWADALCINQKDSHEKSIQIRHMKQIYARAETTFTWLGVPDLDGTTSAMRLLRADLDHDQDGADNALSFCHIRDFCNREYWKRRWVIQEVTAAADVQIICGEESISFSGAVTALRRLQESNHWLPANEEAYSTIRSILEFRDLYQSGRAGDLCSTVFKSRDSLCKDPRDRVFALIGICHDGSELVPLPNYHQSAEEVSRDITRELIRRDRSFELVLRAGWRQDSRRSLGLPSWTPDWLSTSLPTAFKVRFDTPTIPYILASNVSGNFSELQVEGVLLGTVVDRTSLLQSQMRSEGALTNGEAVAFNKATDYPCYYGPDLLHTGRAIVSCILSQSDTSYATFSHAEILDRFTKRIRRALKAGENEYISGLEASGSPSTVFMKWLKENHSFSIHGGSLEKWLTKDFGSAATKRKRRIGNIIFWCCVPLALFLIWFGFSLGLWLVLDGALPSIFIVKIGCVFCTVMSTACSLIVRVGTSGPFPDPQHEAYIDQKPDWLIKEVRRFIMLDCGMCGMACLEAQSGDKLCLLSGCSSVAVLRERSHNGGTQYQVVGRSFVSLSQEDERRYEDLLPRKDSHQLLHSPTLTEGPQARLERCRRQPWWQQFVLV